MAVPVVPDLAVGDKVTAARWNNLNTAINFLLNPPRATVWKSAASTSVANATATLVTWDTEDEDSDAIHSTVTNTSRMTINTPGAYTVSAVSRWASVNIGANTWMAIDIRKNAAGASGGGTSVMADNQPFAGVTGNGMELEFRVRNLIAGDYLEMFVTQNSGGALNLLGGGITLTSFQVVFAGVT